MKSKRLKKGTLRSRQNRTRARVRGVSDRPRLTVFRSNKFIYGQIINDTKGHTMVAAYGANAEEVGEKLAKLAKAKKIKAVVFDRGGYQYHGNVKKLADAARKGGLTF